MPQKETIPTMGCLFASFLQSETLISPFAIMSYIGKREKEHYQQGQQVFSDNQRLGKKHYIHDSAVLIGISGLVLGGVDLQK